MSTITIPMFRNAIAEAGGFLGADGLATAFGTQPGKAWQRKLKRFLQGAGIEPVRAYVGGKRVRVYRATDFAADEQGRVMGTPELSAKHEAAATKNLKDKGVRDVLAELRAAGVGLKKDTSLTPKQRFSELTRSIDYWIARFTPIDESYLS